MTSFLVFSLYGPMASWGETAVGEIRPTANRPTRSGVFGLLAAALGIRRDEEEKLLSLNRSFGFSVCVRRAGSPLRDFHTAMAPSSFPKKYIPSTRKRALEVANKHNCIPSRRDYLCEAFYTVVLWPKEDAAWTFDELASALNEPEFCLYLGRKSCPLAAPLSPQIVDSGNILEAIRENPPQDPLDIFGEISSRASLYWEDGAHTGIQARRTFTRRDKLASRKRWHFYERQEHHAEINLEG